MKVFDGLIAMDDAFCMRGIERVGNLASQLKNLVELQRPGSDALAQSLTLQVLHGQEWTSIDPANVIKRADIRMIQRRGGTGLALGPLQPCVIFGIIIRQKFKRSAESRVFGFVNYAHTADTSFFSKMR
jgi:hypothetical protein